ncbi:MAG: hypothetical protein AAGI90_01335 [Chlamydiota bacterium]
MKRFVRYSFLLAMIFCISLLFLPKLSRTWVGKQLFLRIISNKVGTELSVESFDLAWFGPQKCTQLVCKRPEFDLQIDDCSYHVPLWKLWKAFDKLHLCQVEGTLDLQNASLAIDPLGRAETLFEHIYAKITEKVPDVHIDLDFYARSRNAANIGKCFLHGTVSSTSFHELVMDWSDLSCDLQLNMKRLPVSFFDLFSEAPSLFQSIFGKYLSLEGSLFLDHGLGDIKCDIASSNLTATLNGHLENDRLLLNSPLQIKFFPNNLLSYLLLGKVHPCFSSILSADAPIKVEIDRDGFCLPKNYRDLKIAKGRCDLGKLYAKNTGMLASILTMMKEESLFGVQKMHVWFTPLEFSVENGLVQTKRMDLLIGDTFHCFTWGNIDYLNDQVHLTLAVEAPMLKNSFGIEQLQEDFTLLFPIKGPTDGPSIDEKLASGAIARLILETSGNFLGKKSMLSDRQETIPKARPFPWRN